MVPLISRQLVVAGLVFASRVLGVVEMPGRLEGLKRTLARDDTVVFVGSGVSCWSGLPTWTALLEMLAEYMSAQGVSSHLVRREIGQGDLLQAASYGFYQLTASQRIDFLRSACKVDASEPSQLHEILTQLGPTSYVTTNYDKLLERALSRWCPDRYHQVVGNWSALDAANIHKRPRVISSLNRTATSIMPNPSFSLVKITAPCMENESLFSSR